MKSLVLIFVSFFILVGCAPKKKDVVVPKDKIVVPQEPIVIVEPEIIEPEPIVVEEIEKEPIIEDDGLNKIAIIYPSRIVGPYAKSTISTISAYLIFNNSEFELETFDTYNEDPENILEQINDLNSKGFTKVIAMFTQKGFETLNSHEEGNLAKYYFPLINKSEIFTQNENFIFGGISYEKQMQLLNSFSNGANTMFYVKSYLGNKLRAIYENSFENTGIIKQIERKSNRYKHLMKDERMVGNSIILNTPVVKSSIILSQLTAFEINPKNILSTQLNYDPKLVKFTQARDRKNFFIVSSIDEVNYFLEDYIKLLGSDISYNWVDYSSLVGVNYLINDNESDLVKTKVLENQVEYIPVIYESTSYGFNRLETN